MTKYILLLCLVWGLFSRVVGQTNKLPDSLWLVKKYLIELQNKLPQPESDAIKENIDLLDSLISLGTIHRTLFKNQLEIVASENNMEFTGHLREYDLILQSFILLKTDLKQGHFIFTGTSLPEAQFITEKIPILVHQIDDIEWLYGNK